MVSEKAVNEALKAYCERSGGIVALTEPMRAAIDAAAAVDGDGGWNAAVDHAAHTVVQFGARPYTVEEVAALIRSLKRLK